MDGILIDLLNAKWNTFVKSRFYRQFFLFCFYFVLSVISFTLRPGPSTTVAPTEPSSTPIPSDFPSNVTKQPAQQTPRILSNSNLSEFLEKIVDTGLIPKLRSSLNVTSTTFDKIKLDIVTDVASILKNAFLVDGNENDNDISNYSYESSSGTSEHLYRKNGTEGFLATPSLIDDSDNKKSWYVASHDLRFRSRNYLHSKSGGATSPSNAD